MRVVDESCHCGRFYLHFTTETNQHNSSSPTTLKYTMNIDHTRDSLMSSVYFQLHIAGKGRLNLKCQATEAVTVIPAKAARTS